MATTTNFGWETPDDTDLVKDGAAAIRTALGGVDTSFVDLKGGTTGQVLAKASNTDLDYSWIAVDPLTILDAKGDLISATAADTPARLAVGANDTVLTADSTTATGLKWATASAGGMTQLATGTLSGATTTLSSISGSYKDLRIVVQNFKPTTDGSGLQLRINSDSTAARHTTIDSYGQTQGGVFTTTSITLTADNDNSVATGLVVTDIYDYANTTTWKILENRAIGVNPTVTTTYEFRANNGAYNQTGAITSLQFIVSGGAAAGTYYLFGVK
jgi:hypothetical protein